MPLEQGGRACPEFSEREQALSLTLLDLAGTESVRVIEALAAALVNDLHERPDEASGEWPGVAPTTGLCEDSRMFDDFGGRLGLCRRVARRALRGSLTDPTRGANAFHRIEASPDWARELLPVAVYGPYLFYRR
jgi:N-acetylmuramoyl-L-alanine amidase